MVKIKICILIIVVVVNLSRFECRRGGGGSFGKSFGGFSKSSSSFTVKKVSSSRPSKWSLFGKTTTSNSGSSSSSNSGRASILPLSTGNRNTQHQYTPSAPTAQSGTGLHNPYSPSAPPLPTGNSRQPPGPGWNINHNTGNHRQNVPLNNQPPPYPGMANHGSVGPPPPYTGHSSYQGPPPAYSNAPPPYPGVGSSYSHGQLPPAYPGISRAPAPSMSGSAYYPTQQGGPVYQPHQQYYPPSGHLPPPPPGYSPYGMPYYQTPSSGIRGSDVMMGLAFWQLSRSNGHHHHFHHGSYDDSSYHNYNRNHYTTTYHSTNSNANAPDNQNTLEMTHFVVPDEVGKRTTIMGNQTCVSVYNAKAVNKWATQQMEDFKKKFPNTTFPLFSTGNATFVNNNFTWIPGRIIHIEPISITCCGTHKKSLELDKLTNGKSPDVNCVHLMKQISFRKMNFIQIEHNNTTTTTQNMSEWHPLHLVEPDLNSTTPKPVNVTSTTPLSIDKTQVFTSLGKNATSTTPLSIDETQTFTSLNKNITSTTPVSIDETQTFTSPGVNHTTISSPMTTPTIESVTTSQTLVVDPEFSAVSNGSSTAPEEVVTLQ